MLKEERHHFLLDQLALHGKIIVTQLAKEQKVTPETIRRDLDELEKNEQLTRIHGGAIPFIPRQKEMAYEKKLALHLEEKQLIAKKAASLIQDGDTIVVDVGTTTVHIADFMDGLQNLTVVTNSLSAAERFNLAVEERRMSGQIMMLPGITNPEQASVTGTYTVDFLKKFHFDYAFISCGGLTNEAIYDFDIDESLVSEVMIQQSKEAILLADDSKIEKTSFFHICPLLLITTIISNKEKPSNWKLFNGKWMIAKQEATNYESRFSPTS